MTTTRTRTASSLIAALATLALTAATATADPTITTTPAPSTTKPTTTTKSSTTTSGTTTTATDPTCAPLHVLIANGTGESRADGGTDTDGGFGSAIVIPALLSANTDSTTLISRSYLAYNPGGGPLANKSVESGEAAARVILGELATRCPTQKVMLIGHLQGAQVMSTLAREIGAGKGALPADRVAGVALFSDPTRANGQEIFANKQGPQQIPGAKGKSVTAIRIGSVAASTGGGLSPATTKASYGTLGSRVASFCNIGDISCDIPADAALAKLIGNLAASSKLDPTDPLGSLASVASAVGQSVLYTGASLVSDTVSFDNGQLTVTASDTSVMDRMLTASSPNTRPGEAVTSAVRSLAKIAGIGINAAITVGKSVLSVSSIAEIGAAGLADPIAGLAMLAVKVGEAVVKLVNPVSIIGVAQQVFTEIQSGIVDNAGLVQILMDTRYWDLGAARSSYDSVPIGANGQSAVALTTQWITAAAADLAPGAGTTTTTKAAPSTTPGPVLASGDQTVLTAGQILNAEAPQGK